MLYASLRIQKIGHDYESYHTARTKQETEKGTLSHYTRKPLDFTTGVGMMGRAGA